jgi:hypothetical protein
VIRGCRQTARNVVIVLALTLFTPFTAVNIAHSANPACTPTQSTVDGKIVLEFTNPNTGDSNTSGSNVGYTCDWTVPSDVFWVKVAVVGGGGSGGFGNQGGGGGGGEVLYTSNGIDATPGDIKTITVGAGGAATTAGANIPGNDGARSIYDGVIAHGGGGGGSGGPSSGSNNNGRTGGSTGGGSRFASLKASPTKTDLSSWTSYANTGGLGAGKVDNSPASSVASSLGCSPYGAGGGGGGAMSAGGDAVASCSDSSTAGSINITVGTGGAGIYLFNKCLGGGGASLATSGAPTNAGLVTINQAPKTPCINPSDSQTVVGTVSGGGSGSDTASGVPGTGGGGSGVPFEYGRPAGGSGVVLISYDPAHPPVAPVITTQPDSKTLFSMLYETLTVAATRTDGGTLSYQWQKKAPGANTFSNVSGATSTTYITPTLRASDSGTVYRAVVTNTKNSLTTSTTTREALIRVSKRTPSISFSYPNSNIPAHDPRNPVGDTLAVTSYSFTPSSALNALYSTSTSASICTVRSDNGLITYFKGGSCVVSYTIPEDDYYTAKTVSVTVNLPFPTQTVRWSSLPNLKVNSAPVTLGTTSGYLLATGETLAGAGAITYSTLSCSAFSITSAGVITPRAVGSCAITATQAQTTNFNAGTIQETLTVVAAEPDRPFINSVSSSGGSTSNSGSISVSVTANTENGASITQYVLSASPSGGSAIQETLTAGAGTRSITVTGLTLGTAYSVSVYAINSAGNSPVATYSSTVTPAGAPFAVSGLTATPGNASLTINYTQPASLNGGTWDRYQYFITPVGTTFSDTPTAVSTTQNNQSYTFTGLTNGTGYNIKVVVLTSANSTASAANTTLLNMVPAVVPNAPSISINQIAESSIVVQWSSTGDGGSAITSYTVVATVNGTTQSCTTITSTSCGISGLAARDVIAATASATNIIGTSAITTASSLTLRGKVKKPTSITPSPDDSIISVAFTQQDSGDDVTGYEYTFDGSTYYSIASVTSPVVIAGLTNGTEYSFFIRAIGFLYGAGPLSDTITATAGIPSAPPAPPAPPANNYGSGFTTVIIAIDTATAIDTSTPVIIETVTIISVPETVTIVSGIETVTIWMKEPFRVNSYFINVKAALELKKIATRYKNSNILRITVLGYSSPSLINPYPSKLGIWRATAVQKVLKKNGLKTTYVAKYGGLYR